MGKANKEAENKEKSPFTKIFIKLIKEMTQQEVADLIGVSRQNVGAWIKGDSVPSIYALPKIAEAFNVSTDYLLGRGKIKSDDEDVKIACKVTGLSEFTVLLLSEAIPTIQIRNRLDPQMMDIPVKDWVISKVLPEINVDVSRMLLFLSSADFHETPKTYIHDFMYGAISKSADKYKYKLDEFIREYADKNGIDDYHTISDASTDIFLDYFDDLPIRFFCDDFNDEEGD